MPEKDITRKCLLAHLRAARVRAKLAVLEIDSIGLSLKNGMIDVNQALLWLDDVDALKFLIEPDMVPGPIA